MSIISKTLVVTNDFLFGKGLLSYLEQQQQEAFLCESSDQLESNLLKINPQFLLYDFNATGFKPEKVMALSNFITQCKVIVFAQNLSKSQIDTLKSYGAVGFISKSCAKVTLDSCLSSAGKNALFIDDYLKETDTDQVNLFAKLNISEREIEIIKLIAEGFINKEIADRLFLSTHTVNTHRKNIMQKLGINNTAGIVLFAVKQGIISPSEFLFH